MLTGILSLSGASVLVLLFSLWAHTWGQANGNVRIHFMDVGQYDSALLISLKGETVLFDNGNTKDCTKLVSYLQSLHITTIGSHIASHYHSDHIGCL